MRNRKEILIDLVHNRREIASLVQELSLHPWDSEEPLYIVNSEDIRRVIEEYSQNVIDAETLEHWANAIESRDDLDYENQALKNVIDEMANPVLFGSMSKEKAETYKKEIQQT